MLGLLVSSAAELASSMHVVARVKFIIMLSVFYAPVGNRFFTVFVLQVCEARQKEGWGDSEYVFTLLEDCVDILDEEG